VTSISQLYKRKMVLKFQSQRAERKPPFYTPFPPFQLIILRQPHTSIINPLPTTIFSIPSLLRQNARGNAIFITPLPRGLGLPRPIKPPPPLFKTVHLRLRKVEEKLLVRRRICRGRSVRIGARAAGGIGGRTGGGEHAAVEGAAGCGEHVQRAFPAGSHAHVVEIGGAIRVSLTPFAAERGSETGGFVAGAEGLVRPCRACESYFVAVWEGYLLVVEDDVLVDV